MPLCTQKVWLLVIAEKLNKGTDTCSLILYTIPQRNANDDCLMVDCLHKATKTTMSDKNLGKF